MVQAIPDLLGFVLASVLVELTPGPNMTYLAILAVREGRRSGYVAVAGVALGLALLGAIAALGLAALISASPVLYSILRWAGVLYLFYLAWSSWMSANKPADADGDGKYFLQGLVTNLLNPKAAIYFVAVVPSFLPPGRLEPSAFALLATVYVLIATAIHLAIVTLSGTLAPVLERGAGRVVVARFMAIALACVALWLAWATR